MTDSPDGRDAIRARDADRSLAVELIDAAFSDGQLTAGEREDRCDRVLAAETLGELRLLTRDLQAPAAEKPRRARRRMVPGVVAALVAFGIVVGVVIGNDDEPEAPAPQTQVHSAAPQGVEAEPTKEPDPPKRKPQPLRYSLTERGIRNFITLYRREFGTTKGVAFGLHRDRVNVARRGANDRVRWWQYVDGHFVDGGYYEEREFEPGQIDITDLDIKAMLAGLEQVKDRVGLDEFRYLGASVVIASGQKGAWLVAGNRASCQADWMTLDGQVGPTGTSCPRA